MGNKVKHTKTAKKRSYRIKAKHMNDIVRMKRSGINTESISIARKKLANINTEVNSIGKSAIFVPTSSETDCNESSNSEPVVVKPIIHNSWLGLDTTSTALDAVKTEPNDDSSVSTEVSSDENSSFFQFFRGIHSDYLELPASKQRLFKRKCLNYLHELLDEEEMNAPTPDYTHPANALHLATISYDSDHEDVKPVILVDGRVLPNS